MKLTTPIKLMHSWTVLKSVGAHVVQLRRRCFLRSSFGKVEKGEGSGTHLELKLSACVASTPAKTPRPAAPMTQALTNGVVGTDRSIHCAVTCQCTVTSATYMLAEDLAEQEINVQFGEIDTSP